MNRGVSRRAVSARAWAGTDECKKTTKIPTSAGQKTYNTRTATSCAGGRAFCSSEAKAAAVGVDAQAPPQHPPSPLAGSSDDVLQHPVSPAAAVPSLQHPPAADADASAAVSTGLASTPASGTWTFSPRVRPSSVHSKLRTVLVLAPGGGGGGGDISEPFVLSHTAQPRLEKCTL